MDFVHGFLITVGVVQVGALIWSIYATQRSFQVQSNNFLILGRMADRIERMTEKILTQLPDENVQH